MPQLTIAQLVASISADTSAFDARITKVEEQLRKTQASAEKAAEGISKSFSASAKGVDELAKATQNAQKAADNLAKYEYTIGQKSAAEYNSFLRQRLSGIQGHTTEAKSLYSQLAATEVKITREASEQIKTIKRQEAQFEKDFNKLVVEDAKLTARLKIKAEQDVANAQREASKIAQESAKQYQNANKEKLQSDANFARIEYETGAKSAEQYAFFLEQRMAAYHIYSSQWKAASAELLALQKGMAVESENVEKQKQADILAREKEIGAERIALEKEINAEMTAWNKQYVAGFVVQMDEAALAAEASAKRTRAIRNGTIGMAGAGAAAITAVELGSAVISQQFNHELTGQANNTLMTDADIAKMKNNVIELGKETGQNLQDLSVASRWIADFSKSTDTASGKLNQLKWANKEAVATMSNTGDVARSLAATMHIFGANTNEAAGYIDVLHHSAAAGAMTVQQFAVDAGPALAIAASMHDKFYDAAAAMSSLTKAGFDSAEAATQIKSLYAHIGEPADKATKQIIALDKAFKKLNPDTKISLVYDFSPKGIETKGIVGLLKDIETVTAGNAQLIAKAIPALRGGIGGTSLAQALGQNGNDVEALRSSLKSLQQGNTGSETETVYNRMAKDGLQQWKKLAVEIETDFIPIGERAMKVFEKSLPLIKGTANAVVSVMEAFQRLPLPIQETVTALGGLFILTKLGLDFARMFGATATMISGFKFLVTAISSSDGIVAAFRLAAGGAGTLGEALMACSVGPAAPILVMVAAVAALAYGLYLLKQAQDDATASAARLGQQQNTLASKGVRGATTAQISRNTSESSDLYNAIQTAKNDPYNFTQFQNDMDIRKELSLRGYDTKNHSYNSEEGASKRMKQLDTDAKTMQASMTNSINVSMQSGTLGTKAALAADVEQANKSATNCEQRAKENIQTTTHAFDSLFQAKDSQGRVTAKSVMAAMQSAGVLQHYSPGMQLKPGDLLYSNTVGSLKDTGHVQTIDSSGNRRDQYGANHFSPSNFQGYFDPDYAMGVLHGNSPTPGSASQNGKAVTSTMLTAQAIADKAAEKARKEAIAAAKSLETRYESEVRSLEKIITLKGVSSDLDNKHTNLNKVLFDVSSKGDLAGISASHEHHLKLIAENADIAEQTHKVDLLIKKMQEKAIIDRQSPLKQEAIASMGGLDNWRSLNPSQSAQALTTQLQTDREQSETKNAKRMKDLAFYATLAGDGVKKAAVEAEGGVDKWNLLSKAVQNARVESERHLQITDALSSAKLEWERKLLESANTAKTEMGVAEVQIMDLKDKYKIKPSDHSYDKQFGNIRAQAITTEANHIDDYLDKLEDKSKAVQKIFELDNKKSLDYNPKAQAMAQFDKDNAEEILRIEKLTGAIYNLRKARLDLDRETAGNDALKDYNIIATRELDSQTQALNDKSNSAAYMSSQSFHTPGDRAVAEWENTPQGIKMITALGKLSDAVINNEDAIRFNTNIEQKLALAQERRQEITGGITNAIFSGVMGGLSSNPQQKGQYQSQLLSQQQEMRQYQVAQAEFKSKYPNDPNDPYTKRLKDLQKEIDNTNHKLSAMGGNINTTFKRMFDSMAQSFEQTLSKMAQDYLKSQLLQYITKQVGTGQSFAGQSGGGGFLGGIVSVLGSVLGGIAGNGSASAASIPGASQEGISTVEGIKFGDGGDFKAGTPFWAGERGSPELIVPNYNGSVIPASKISRGSSGGGGTTIHNVINNMTVNTPDVRGFQSSRATIMQEYSRSMRPRR